MPFISSLKESFAIAPIQERESVVKKLAAANTDDAYYYQGLVLLQKIHSEILKEKDPTKPRKPTSVEAKLFDEMQNLLLKMSAHSDNFLKVNTRFHLLIYPFETRLTTEFIKKTLNLDLKSNSVTEQEQCEFQAAASSYTSSAASALDPNLIDGVRLLKSVIDDIQANIDIDGWLDIEVLALPVLSDILLSQSHSFTDKQKAVLLKKIFSYAPSDQIFGKDLIRNLSELWKVEHNYWKFDKLPFYNFTLRQMDQLISEIPEIVLSNENFVQAYLEKLAPLRKFDQQQFLFWDDCENELFDYLNRLTSFCLKLPDTCYSLKSAIKFHKLRSDVVRKDYDQKRFLEYN